MLNNITIWLDETAKYFPDKVAFVDENKKVTFKELQQLALEVAGCLLAVNIYKSPVAIMIEKSVDTLVAFMGVAYSRNFYTVLDVHMPVERKQKIVDVFQPKAMLIMQKDKEQAEELLQGNSKIFCLDKRIENIADVSKIIENRESCCDTDLLYVLFTSGSTGIPKGVTICHRSVIDYIDWVTEKFNITEKDSFGNQAPFYFDNSVLDIYTTIKTGATLEIIPERLFAQPVRLLDYIREKKINTIFWVPSELVLVANLHALKKVELKGILKRILFAGEVMPTKQLNEWRKYLPDVVYANLYGPTEITVDCTYYILDREFADDEPIPIGFATKNTEVLVLNEQNELVKEKEIGELCVRGTSLSLGYYNNIEKTKEVFVQNPLNKNYLELIYRTGDLVYYNERKELIYVSRKDFQIKHMGHRIELGEIENITSAIQGIDRCCCIYDNYRKKIVLFVEGKQEIEMITNKLKQKLPTYMLPGRLIQVEQLPLNENGKVDRKQLQERL